MRLFKATLTLLFTAAALSLVSVAPAKDMTELRIVVLDQDGDPVPRAGVSVARVVSKPGAARLKVRKARFNLRTSMQGAAPLPPIPQGRYLVQVISPGFQTHGSTQELTEPEQTVTITLEPPQDQVSVHKKKP